MNVSTATVPSQMFLPTFLKFAICITILSILSGIVKVTNIHILLEYFSSLVSHYDQEGNYFAKRFANKWCQPLGSFVISRAKRCGHDNIYGLREDKLATL